MHRFFDRIVISDMGVSMKDSSVDGKYPLVEREESAFATRV